MSWQYTILFLYHSAVAPHWLLNLLWETRQCASGWEQFMQPNSESFPRLWHNRARAIMLSASHRLLKMSSAPDIVKDKARWRSRLQMLKSRRMLTLRSWRYRRQGLRRDLSEFCCYILLTLEIMDLNYSSGTICSNTASLRPRQPKRLIVSQMYHLSYYTPRPSNLQFEHITLI